MNAMSTSKNTKWIMKDKKTGKENMDIDYRVKVGDIKKIRLFNDPKSMHPMQHPIHLHGQRFLVISEDEKMNKNLAWKDTALVPKGSTVDLLVEFTNPGKWMMHCHVAEHLEAGMMSMFIVT
jgi:FtsP/CotA-like multicopper oxidase with cupredoxin domain